MSAGTVITGGVVSRAWKVMVTVNVPVPVFPCASVAEHVSVVEPTGNLPPELSGVHVAVSGPSMLSVAVTVNVSTLPVGSAVVSVMSAGTVTTGLVVSWTVTLNDAVDVAPKVSVAVHVTFVVPNGNVEPDAGLHALLTTWSPGSGSVNVTV